MNFNLNLNEEKISLHIEGDEVAYINFKIQDNIFTILKTVVYPSFKGHGYGKKLIDYCMNYANENNMEVNYTCSFAENYLNKIK